MSHHNLKETHQTALERFKLVATLEQSQRARELEDLKFADPIDPSDQWPTDALNSRAGLPARGSFPPVPPRPALTINKLRQPLQQVINAERQARLSLVFAPDGEGTSQEDAAVFEDIARAIQADSRAHLARNWAFDRCVKCGRGYYRIDTEYVNDRSRDQKIVYKRILNQFSVYYDPFSTEPDYSDAQWCFVTEDIPWPEYKRRFRESDLAQLSDDELTATGDAIKGWMTEGDQGRMIRIAEYFFFETVDDELVHVPIADTGEVKGYYRSELQAQSIDEALLLRGDDGALVTRGVELRKLRWGKMNGVEFLRETGLETIVERDGEYIPIVPVIADESNINGVRRYTGLVRPSMDAQRLFNVEASSLAEAVHLGPLAPFIGYAEVFEGFESWWAQMNTRRFPYLPINSARDSSGNLLPPPQRNVAEQPIQAIALSLKEAEHYIDITTGIPPAALGQLDPHERSGKAILALQNQSQLSTSGYVDNLANLSMLLEGKILRDLIPKIYDRRGRIVAAQGDDDSRRTVMLNAPFTQEPKGPPKPAAPGTDGSKLINLHAAQVAVSPTVGKSFTTKREEAAAQLGELAQAVPELVPAFADIWVKNMDGPGFRQIGDRLAKAVPPQFRDDHDMASQGAKLQQQVQMLTQQLEEVGPLADKNRADLMKTKLQQEEESKRSAYETDARVRIAGIQADASIATAEIKVGMDDLTTRLGHLETLIGLHSDHLQQDKDHAHEREMAQMSHEQAVAQGEQAHQQTLEAQAAQPQGEA